MLSWLQNIMKGDQNDPPGDVVVERDAEGRIVSASAKLSMQGSLVPAVEDKLVLSEALKPRLLQAATWLQQQNIHLASNHAVGQEYDYTFSQETGELILLFEDGRKLVAKGQILGSFDPRNGSFMWAWHNATLREELCRDAELVRSEGERIGELALTRPLQKARFNDLTPIMALAAQTAGADGVYRCLTNDSTSVFVCYWVDHLILADGQYFKPRSN